MDTKQEADMGVTKESFGFLEDKREAFLYTIENQNGFAVKVTDFGVNIVSLLVKNKEGNIKDVALGYDTLEEYFENGIMFGATVGRNVNRISNARFEIDGKEYHVAKNRGKHNIHSDKEHGFHKVLWDSEIIDDHAVKFTYVSPDGEQGFPGTLETNIIYTVTETNGLIVSYHAVSDKKTLINLTNHNYFNLGGHESGTIENTKVRIYADEFTPINEDTIPTGEIRKVEHTPMDFREWKKIKNDLYAEDEQLEKGKGYDHNFVIRNKDCGFRKMAEALDEEQGIKMEVYSDLPGLQFYTGNTMKSTKGKGGVIYGKGCGFCMEPHYFPNSINTKEFDAPVFIAPGLFILHCGLAGLSFALMHILKICIGTTFSCGLIDFMLYGVLQGQTKSNWMMILPVFAVYAVLYYFVFKFVIEKFDLPTPGRDDDEEEVKLYTKADYQAKKGAANEDTDAPEDPISFMILKGLGGIKNIEDIDCCATRLRITVTDETKVTDQYLKQSGSKGIIKKGTGIQIIYGPQVSVIKSNFEEYVEYYAQHGTDPSKEEEVTPIVSSKEEEKKEIRHGKLVAVATGKVFAMTQAKDEAFATCAMGDGVVIEPEKGVVVAPADGKITALMKPSLHAIGIETKEGLNLLIHIGIDTVKLDGKGFKSFVKSGQEVKAGDKLVEFDIDLIKKEGCSPDVMVVVLEDSNLPKVAYKTGEKTVAGKTVVAEF